MKIYNYLYSFVSAYRYGNFSHAAQELNTTQPNITQHIKALEKTFARPLFRREGKSIYPTNFAHELFLKCNKTFENIDSYMESIIPNEQKKKGTIHIGCPTDIIQHKLVPKLAPLTQEGFNFYYTIGEADDVLSQLKKSILDVAVFTKRYDDPSLSIKNLFKPEFILVGHKSWIDKINLNLLKKNDRKYINSLPWAFYDHRFIFSEDFFEHHFSFKSMPNPALIVPDVMTLVQAVLTKQYLSILPAHTCEPYLSRGTLVSLINSKNIFTIDVNIAVRFSSLKSYLIRKVLKRLEVI